jgi:hypothetical protein
MTDFIGLYSVKDVVAQEFSPPFLAKNDEVALRQFSQFLTSLKGASHSDFKLFQVGFFSLDTGCTSSQDDFPVEVKVKVPGIDL